MALVARRRFGPGPDHPVAGQFPAGPAVLAGWAYFSGRSDPRRARLIRAGLLAGGTCLVLVPVTLRNYGVGGELTLTTSQGGANFYIGNNELADGGYVFLPFVRPDPLYEAKDFQAEAERRSGRALTPSQVSRFWFRAGLAWMADHPAGPSASPCTRRGC